MNFRTRTTVAALRCASVLALTALAACAQSRSAAPAHACCADGTAGSPGADCCVKSAGAETSTGPAAAHVMTHSPAASAAPALPAVDAAPDFTLTDTNGRAHRLADYRGKVVVLEWVNHGCPFVKKHYGPGNMQAIQRAAAAKGVVWLSICSSADGKQGHMSAADWNSTIAATETAAAAVLIDADGTVGRLYDAKTTPHMFVIRADGGIAYRGAIDDRATPSPADIAGARDYVVEAIDAVLAGKAPATTESKPYGCSVKYPTPSR